MIIDNQVEDKKLQNDVNWEAEKFQLHHQAKLIYMNILQVKKYYPLIKKEIKKQAKFIHSPLGKAFEKQAKEQVKLIKDLNISGKTNELKQIERIFPRNLLNDLIRDKMIEILIHKTILN